MGVDGNDDRKRDRELQAAFERIDKVDSEVDEINKQLSSVVAVVRGVEDQLGKLIAVVDNLANRQHLNWRTIAAWVAVGVTVVIGFIELRVNPAQAEIEYRAERREKEFELRDTIEQLRIETAIHKLKANQP